MGSQGSAKSAFGRKFRLGSKGAASVKMSDKKSAEDLGNNISKDGSNRSRNFGMGPILVSDP